MAQAARHLAACGIPRDEADLDARLLARTALGWDAARLIADGLEEPPAAFQARFDGLVARRASREPMAYITGCQEFWNRTFTVTPAVLIPRPETELIIEAALERCPTDHSLRIADACTGSGCLAIVMALERPLTTVVATDVSVQALKVARTNARSHGVADRVTFEHADLLEGVKGPFDLIVSNPPYVPEGDRASLPPEVRDHEPGLAIFAGNDGLDVIRRLLPQSVEKLAPAGRLIIEIGFGQAQTVESLISATPGLTMIELRRDLQGIPRTAIAARTDSCQE